MKIQAEDIQLGLPSVTKEEAIRAAKCAPQAQLITLDNFLADPHLDALYNALTSTTPVLDAKAEAAAIEELTKLCKDA